MPYEFRDRYAPVLQLTRDEKYKLVGLEQRVVDLQRAMEDTALQIAACQKKKDELLRQKKNVSTISPPASAYTPYQSGLEHQVQGGYTHQPNITPGLSGSPQSGGLENIIQETEKELSALKQKINQLESELSKVKSERNKVKSDFEHKKNIVRAFLQEAEDGRKESQSKGYDIQGAIDGTKSNEYEIRNELQQGINFAKRRETEFQDHYKELSDFLRDMETPIQLQPQEGRYSIPGGLQYQTGAATNNYSGLDSIVDKFKSFASPQKVAEMFTRLFPLEWVAESLKKYNRREFPKGSEHIGVQRPPYYYNQSSIGQVYYQRPNISTMTRYSPIWQFDYNTHSYYKR